MPKMVEMELNPQYRPKDEKAKADYKALAAANKDRPMKEMPHVTAVENMRLSNGMLRIKSKEPNTGAKVEMALEDMPTDQLKMMMLTAGVTPTGKKMDRAQVIQSIRTKMGSFDIEDSEEAETKA